MAAVDLPDDNELIRRSIAGDKGAYGMLVTRYMQRAYYLARTFTGSHEDALDMSQDAFVRLWRSLKKLDPDKDFFPYFYAILRNLCLNAVRNAKKRAMPFSSTMNDSEISGTASIPPDSVVTLSELPGMVEKAMERISAEDREIILLKDVHGYSYKEIAVLLTIPIGTVMSRLYTARSRFKKCMKEMGYEHSE
jgi:RNA polymerase sigma-70 factor, ECF subfamily